MNIHTLKKKKQIIEELIESKKGSLKKFVTSNHLMKNCKV